MSYVIITDTSADLPREISEKYGIEAVPLSYTVDGEEYVTKPGDDEEMKRFYDLMRERKHEISTSMANGQEFAPRFESILKEGKDILYIGFSSGLSGTVESVSAALLKLSEKYPERKVYSVDTLAASAGEGLIVLLTARKREEGATIDEARDYAESIKLSVCHWFTVDDLDYLRRGGRISKAVAIIGSVLQIKPVLHVNDEGHLIAVGRAKGRKASIEKLCAKIGARGINPSEQTIMISHGDCLEDAEYAAEIIKRDYSPKEVIISYVDTTIGAHSGPGTLAIFFLGEKR